jgi:hypothetical protein
MHATLIQVLDFAAAPPYDPRHVEPTHKLDAHVHDHVSHVGVPRALIC